MPASTAIRPPESLRTERLCLRQHRAADAEAIFAAYGRDPTVSRYLTWRPHRSVEDSRRWIAVCNKRWRSGELFTWAITQPDEDTPIGAVGCRVRAHSVLLGYMLAEKHWNRGFATESVSALVAWAESVPSVWRVWAVCDVENPASARVLEKVGMTREGILRRWIAHPNRSDEPRDCVVYSKVRPWT